MVKNDLKYRMYGLVAYQLSGTIHAGIQFGHAVVEYGRNVNGIKPFEKIYNKWADCDKTFIILNGGTTNKDPEKLGTLNQHLNTLNEVGVILHVFFEPDLGDQLTAIVFIVDERVFNKKDYPDFEVELPSEKLTKKQLSHLEKKNNDRYQAWKNMIGGEKNVFLREFLSNFRLA
jgi:hypothetical protein